MNQTEELQMPKSKQLMGYRIKVQSKQLHNDWWVADLGVTSLQHYAKIYNDRQIAVLRASDLRAAGWNAEVEEVLSN